MHSAVCVFRRRGVKATKVKKRAGLAMLCAFRSIKWEVSDEMDLALRWEACADSGIPAALLFELSPGL